ncbi:bifunctional DNA primase/polymerase [Solwaraspora sp. WMMD791]|uniref:bifunctional DNA primase/polymerase n=1 Tax=Solwaraspora sp. WMMD791 TaxID=3016086 RepID=UPI00249CB35F|nr:bifunctional DNA primase/polymerase [Solwaraspora sp. WMMD791]WFE30852.1 bifunctional DNA primase/polymerase [Solwaraspora sp. WMMD791]
MPELLAAALDHAARGWHVFPLRPDSKLPAFPDHDTDRCDHTDPRCRAAGRHVTWQERATTDPGRIRRAWTQRPYGVGVACGPSGLVVIDCDTRKPDQTPPDQWGPDTTGLDVLTALADQHGGGIEPTYAVSTGRGGTHLYYQHPAGPALRNTSGGLGWLVDTRANGGYVVAAGSTAAGRPYQVLVDCDPAPLPDWLTRLLRPVPLPPQQPVAVDLGSGRRAAYLTAAIRNQIDHLTAAPEGQRNHALYLSAVALGQLVAGGALTDSDVRAALEPAARSLPGRTPLTDREIARTITSGLRAGAHRPRTVAA